jgi:hypothetical protein
MLQQAPVLPSLVASTATYLKNEHGVVIKLISTDVGLKFTLSADGVHVSLKH